MTINGNGVTTGNGVKLLQLMPINVITIVTTIVCAVGLYYKFDSRIATLEKSASSTTLLERVEGIAKKVDENTNRTVRVDTNVLWLMSAKAKEPSMINVDPQP